VTEHVLAVAPQRFSIAGHSLGGWVAQEVAGAALALIEEAGHCSPIEQPQAFTAVMRLWLTR
jgi:pimeloyl-ACP methyl ester carboxylesterase